MRIAQLSSNVEKTPPEAYGGTELIVHLITEELVKRGHDVTLFATGDSETSANLVSVLAEPLRTNQAVLPRQWQAYDIRLLLKLSEMSDQFDVIHNHMGYQALPYLERLHCPVITTNHNPVKDYCRDIYFQYGHMPFVAISNAYRRLNYPERLNYVSTIYNGIDLCQFKTNCPPVKRGDSLLFIGRICYDKGAAAAIEIAQKLDLPIKLAGKIDPADEAYFDRQVKPHLKQGCAEYVGEVNHKQKLQLYKEARAVVYPIAFDEPFGLVMAESLACGTPLMALNRGSVQEVLSDETAIIAQSTDELVRRFPEVLKITSEACQKRVQALFSHERMVDSYLELYSDLLSERRGGDRKWAMHSVQSRQ